VILLQGVCIIADSAKAEAKSAVKEGRKKAKEEAKEAQKAKKKAKGVAKEVEGVAKEKGLSMTRKCCHSRAWHKAYDKAIGEGQSILEAKARAKGAGQACNEQWDLDYANALIARSPPKK